MDEEQPARKRRYSLWQRFALKVRSRILSPRAFYELLNPYLARVDEELLKIYRSELAELRREVASLSAISAGALVGIRQDFEASLAGDAREAEMNANSFDAVKTIRFGMITNGKRPRQLGASLRALRRLSPRLGVSRQLVIAGAVEQVDGATEVELNALRAAGWDVARVEEASLAGEGRLGALRNRIVEHERGGLIADDLIVLLDDDVVVHSGFLGALAPAWIDLDVGCPTVFNVDLSRYWDWSVFRPRQELVPYWTPAGDETYVTGGCGVYRNRVFDAERWDETLGFYEQEDVRFSRALREAGFRFGVLAGCFCLHNDERYEQWHRVAGSRQAAVKVDAELQPVNVRISVPKKTS